MSLTNAPATCSRNVAAFAFQPNRPSFVDRVSRIPDVVEAAGDAIAVGVVGICERGQRCVVDRLEQAEADERRRLRGTTSAFLRARIAVWLHDVEHGNSQHDGRAVAAVVFVLDPGLRDMDLGHPECRVILQLQSEDRQRHVATGIIGITRRRADPDQRLRCRIARADHRASAAVVAMTTDARVVVEQRSELRRLPVEVERAAARLRERDVVVGKVRRGVRERLRGTVVDRRIAAEPIFTGEVVAARNERDQPAVKHLTTSLA